MSAQPEKSSGKLSAYFRDRLFKNMASTSQEFIRKFLACTRVMIVGLLKTFNVDEGAQNDKIKRILKVIAEVLSSSSLKEFYDAQRLNQTMFKFIRFYITKLQYVINNIEKPEVRQSLTEQLKKLTKEHKDAINSTEYNGKDFPHQFKHTKNVDELIPRIVCFIKFNILYSLEAQKCKITDIDTDSMLFLNTVMNVMRGFICAHLNSIVFSFNAQFLKLKYTRNRCYDSKMFRLLVLNDENVMQFIPEGLDPTVFKHMKGVIAICGEAMIDHVFQKTIEEVNRKFPAIKFIKKGKNDDTGEGDEEFPDLSDSSEGKPKRSANAKKLLFRPIKKLTLRRMSSDNDDEVATNATPADADADADEEVIFIKGSDESGTETGTESGTEAAAKETSNAETNSTPKPNTEAEAPQSSDDDYIWI